MGQQARAVPPGGRRRPRPLAQRHRLTGTDREQPARPSCFRRLDGEICQYWQMPGKSVYRVSRVAAAVLQSGGVIVAVILAFSLPASGSIVLTLVWPFVLVFFGMSAAVIVHEAGHALACLALGVEIRAVHLGKSTSSQSRFTVGKITVWPGWMESGLVEHACGTRSVGRNTFITVAGPLADLIAAGALLAAGRAGQPCHPRCSGAHGGDRGGQPAAVPDQRREADGRCPAPGLGRRPVRGGGTSA